MKAKYKITLTNKQFNELSKYWFDLSKISFGSLIIKLFEPGAPEFVWASVITLLLGLTLVVAFAILGLRFFKESK